VMYACWSLDYVWGSINRIILIFLSKSLGMFNLLFWCPSRYRPDLSRNGDNGWFSSQ
jgi:hypothetical protein